MGTPAAAGVPTFQFMGVHLHHLAAVALTLPDCTSIGAPRLRQRQDGQAAKSLAGKVIRTRVGRQPQLFTPPEGSPPVVPGAASRSHTGTATPAAHPAAGAAPPPPPGGGSAAR